ncbi:hypothetical protein STENM36S_05422 [Streptomyces tendae]
MLGHACLLSLDKVPLSLVEIRKDVLPCEGLQDSQAHGTQLLMPRGVRPPFPPFEPATHEPLGRLGESDGSVLVHYVLFDHVHTFNF